MTLRPLLLTLFALALAGPAAAQSGTCFRLSDMGNHRAADSQTLYVAMGRKEVWRFDMNGACLSGVGFGDPLVVTPTGGASLICKPLDLDIKVSHMGMLSPCMLKAMTKLSPAEVEALPKKLKP